MPELPEVEGIRRVLGERMKSMRLTRVQVRRVDVIKPIKGRRTAVRASQRKRSLLEDGRVANVLRHALPVMIDRGMGVAVNFSSGWGRSTSPEVAPYCATKWAIEGLTQSLAEELPGGVAAVALNPGVIDTDMLRSAWGDGAAAYPDPEEWARRAVPFLEKLGAGDNGGALSV